MSDMLGRLISIIVTAIAVIFLPIIALSIKAENTTRSMIETSVTEFVDNARATGKITAEEYKRCYSEISSYQSFLTMTMTHSSRMWASDEEAVPFYADFSNQEILDVIFKEEKDYEMRNGDYLKVTVVNTKPTLATNLYRIIIRNGNDISIYVNYSGLVGNYVEE